MKIYRNARFAVCINPTREVILLTTINSKYDKNIFQHPDWYLPVWECTTREAINNIKKILKDNPHYTLFKHK